MKNNYKKIFFLALFFTKTLLFAEIITPSLAYKLAIENSNELKSSKFQLESKKENLNQIKAELYPQVNISAAYNNILNKANTLQKRSNYNIKENSTDLTLSISQNIYNKEIYTKLDLEEKKVKLSEIRYERQKQELIKNVLNIYMNLLISNSKIDLYNSYINFHKYTYKLISKQYSMNLSNKIDYLKAKVELEKMKIDYVKEKKQNDIYMMNLKKFINKENIEIINLKPTNLPFEMIAKIKDSIKSKKLEDSLEIRQAREAIKLTKLEINKSNSARYPKVGLNARYTKYISNYVDVDYENSKKISLELKFPIYQGGLISSREEAARLNSLASKEDLIALEKNLVIKLDEINKLLGVTLNSVGVFNEALISAESYLESVKIGFDKGLESILELQKAQVKLYEMKFDFINNLKEIVDLYTEHMIITNSLDNINYIDNLLLRGSKK